MKLFSYNNYELEISEEAMLIKAFRNVVKRDKSRSKANALTELGYIYFMYDPRSEYIYINDMEERAAVIKEHMGIDSKWEPDDITNEAILVYKDLIQTPFSLLLDDVLTTINRIRIFLKGIDLNEEDDKGRPKHTLSSVVGTLKMIPKMVEELAATQKAINKEIGETGRMRANRTKKVSEDGFNTFIK